MHKYTNAIFSILIILASCHSDKSGSTTSKAQDPRFAQYISSFTSGIVSRRDNIRVRFDESVTIRDDITVDELLEISPDVNGTLVKTGPHEVTFSPDGDLLSGQTYAIALQLDAVAEVTSDLSVFEFDFQVIKQDFDVNLSPIDIPDASKPNELTATGQINLADYAENDAVEKMISLPEGLSIVWQHRSTTSHGFTVSGITRQEEPSEIAIEVSGAPVDINQNSSLTLEVPSVERFDLLSTKVRNGPSVYISVFFTDPLDAKQNLDGLILLEGVESPNLVVKGNELQIFVPNNLKGVRMLEISEGLRNAQGKALANMISRNIAFEPERPQVKLSNSGTIIPSTDGLVLPFEAVNLKAVQVNVFKVFADNIPQFFQVNSLSGQDQLTRVGQMVLSQRVVLEDQAADLSTWNRFTLELSSMFEADPGALYQLQIGFSPEDSNYPCDELITSDNADESGGWSVFGEDGFDRWGGPWGYSYPYGYNWSERENPCKVSYYHSDRFPKKSLLASDLGIIAKIGADNSMNVITTDMKTAQPVPANIKVLDFQLQELETSVADASGQSKFLPERRPFLVVAEHQGQQSYLHLNDNTSLSMSNFDVSGSRVRNGLKGFIYGERGVWRPGDDIYLSFMLEDPEDKLPANHPVTLELRDPRGTVKDRQVSTTGVNGLYTFKTKTADDALTGYWQAKVSVGNSHFNKTVKIETIKPNRLRIDLDFGEQRIPYANRNLSGQMEVNWLTGLKGSDLDVETELRLNQTNTAFDGYAQYEFDDESKSFYESPRVVYSGKVDEEGKTNLEVQLPAQPQSPGALRATFNTKAFEPGGGFSINTKSYTYLPYESFVGINLTTAENGSRIKRGEDQNLAIITLNEEGELASKSGLELEIYRLDWRWWWDESADNTANYISSGYARLMESRKFNTEGGKANVPFRIGREDWGRFIAIVSDPSSGHSASKVFYTSWYGGAEGGSLGATSLQVSTDKSDYSVGETINLMMQGSKEGNALVSIENGSTVLENFWVKTEEEWTSLEIPATAGMAPNVYVHVTLLQPHGQTVNDLPIRLYGIAPIKVFDPKSKLSPVISMQDEIEPGELVEFEISESNDRAMSYTIAVVDEGLLDITNFTTPKPWDHFYSKEAIGVKTWDLYDDVIGAYGGRLERLLAIGGGEGGLQESDNLKENRFKPVVRFMGPYYLKPGETAEHSYVMPEYIGSVKTMVVAGLDQSYGSVDATTPVVKPLMVQGTMPRVVGPGERVSLPVNVFRYIDKIKSADVEVSVNGVLSLAGAQEQSIELDKESGTLYFDLEVAEQIGNGQITISAKSGRENARHVINMTSRAPNSPQTVVKVVQVEKGQSETMQVDLFGMEGTNEVSLEIASIPPININQRLKYLMRYPHGCIEQTVSAVFPQLYLAEIAELSNEEKVKTESNIQAAIRKLNSFRLSSGGLSYWPGSNYASSWGTNYAYHFLIEAQKMGYAVPDGLMTGLRKYQRSAANQWSRTRYGGESDLTQAYRLFTLAIAGYPELGTMNRLRSTTENSYEAICKLAAGYAAIGQTSVAEELIVRSEKEVKERPYPYYRYSYGSYYRDLAILLETYVYLEDGEEAFKLIRQLSERLSSDAWMSTQETAYSLLAIGKYIDLNESNNPLAADISYGNAKTEWQANKAVFRSDIEVKDGEELTVLNKGDATLFATLTVTGTPKPGEEIVGQSDLGIKVRYITPTGRATSIDSVALGESFDVLVTVTNQYQYGGVRDIALTHILPSGWEIQNDRLNDQASDEYDTFDYQDVRDDRVYTYFHLDKNESKTFKVSATATYPGRYYLPGPYAEAMYKASIHAKDDGKWVTVYQ